MSTKSRQISRKEAYTWIGVSLVIVTFVGVGMTHQHPAPTQAEVEHQQLVCAQDKLAQDVANLNGDKSAAQAAFGRRVSDGCKP